MKKVLIAAMATLTVACNPGKDSTFHFDEMTYSPSETVFKLFAPADAKCQVVVGEDTLQMTQQSDTIWTATAKGDQKGKEYVFVVNGQASPGVFAKAVTVNGQKGVVVDLRDTDPEGWADDKPVRQAPQDIVVYEMHHRDFSIAREDAKYPGKFLALTEPWAIEHLTELGITAVHILPSYDYGSVDETKLDTPQYNWGYDPVNYNVPEGSYSTDPYDATARIREFKQMVQALHKAGIAVILDVVYNHTYNIDNSNFQRTYPDYYYRKVPAPAAPAATASADAPAPAAPAPAASPSGDAAPVPDGSSSGDAATAPAASPSGDAAPVPDGSSSGYSNGSGCGNETASEKPMMRQFMLESVKYWVNEYHIDGFRFDLMGCHDIETMNQIRAALTAIDPNIFIYGEGWSAGSCGLPGEQLGIKANIPQMPGIAAFSDEIRDALRGPFSDDTKPGWLGGAPDLDESLKFGIAGAIAHPQVDMEKVNYSKAPWALEPTQMMSYVSCHDDMCLTDRLRASIKGLDKPLTSYPSPLASDLIRLDLLAQTAVFTSQGVPFMLSGEELLRDKKGVHNSFESPDDINHLDWANKTRYPQVFDYYKNLIALRKHHPAFRMGSAELVRKHLEFLSAPKGVVAFRLKEHAGGDQWRNIIVVLNSYPVEYQMAVPRGNYTIVCRDGVINEQGLGTTSDRKVAVAPRSALILHD